MVAEEQAPVILDPVILEPIVILASYKVREQEREKIKSSNFSDKQKDKLRKILSTLEFIIDKIQEINFNEKLNPDQKSKKLDDYSTIYDDLQRYYRIAYANFENGAPDELENGAPDKLEEIINEIQRIKFDNFDNELDYGQEGTHLKALIRD